MFTSKTAVGRSNTFVPVQPVKKNKRGPVLIKVTVSPVLEQFVKMTEGRDGCYFVQLPMKETELPLQSNWEALTADYRSGTLL